MSPSRLARSASLALANFVALLLWIALAPLAFGVLLTASLAAHLTGSHNRERLATEGNTPPIETLGNSRLPASIVIPNWNGRELLEKYLPSVIAACDFTIGDEIIVVDNASGDGSHEMLQTRFPQVRAIRLHTNQGFGGGCNAGIQQARCGHVVLLNSDMRVESDFLPPLLQPFSDPKVFAVAAQILFSDPSKRREETGLTYADFCGGELALGHDTDCETPGAMPCFYPGGGSSAFDRAKLLEIGGFDHLFRPFYLEDTDLGMEAWKRGWKVMYQPASVVYHEHRGTIGKKFSRAYIDEVIQKNRLLFNWKHLDSPVMLTATYFRTALSLFRSAFAPGQISQLSAIAVLRASLQLSEVVGARFRSSRSANVSTREALKRHRPDFYSDRFRATGPIRKRLQVLFLSPYPIYPPHHGGALLMSQTLQHLVAHCDVHLVVLLESESERPTHQAHASQFASLHLLVRGEPASTNRFGALPKSVREFQLPALRKLIHRLIYEKEIDVLQLEYTNMTQYLEPYRSILTALFEHDVYFQTVGRRVITSGASSSLVTMLEYLRALPFELRAVQSVDYVQVCSSVNADFLRGYQPGLGDRLDANLRAGIDIASYRYTESGRLPSTLLFMGNFRHTPNQEGLEWLITRVMPAVVAARPEVQLRAIGANASVLRLRYPQPSWLEILGEVPEIHSHLAECALFVCPVLTGSGVRVKLLEVFAAGIPAVSTSIGVEGLSDGANPVCRVADKPDEFAAAILSLLDNPNEARSMAQNARRLVERTWDARVNTRKLVARYEELLQAKRRRTPAN